MFIRLLLCLNLLVACKGVVTPESSKGAASQSANYDSIPETKRLNALFRQGNDRDLAIKVDQTLKRMVELSISEFRKHGFDSDAEIFARQYQTLFERRIHALVVARSNDGVTAVGDYAPMSAYLTELYDRLEVLLGSEVLAFTHLEDIKTLNYTIPVVFHFSSIPEDAIDSTEYGVHFVPLAGVIAYWDVWGACTIVTWGGGWFFICTPAGMVSKHIVVKFIAPRFASRFYHFFYSTDFL